VLRPIPDTMISRPSPFSLFGDCQVRGHDIPYLGADVVDACTIRPLHDVWRPLLAPRRV
jgi:hypothetical protein